MSLSVGTRLGPYEIVAPIGAGGMGEVYRAWDTRLDRIVAVKVSNEQFSERFEREARAVAALNHSNICTLHDVGPNYLVMEYIEGTPLRGPLPLNQALKYAAQICEALDAAHRKGITHRDLKPANILVTKSGVKLLDFGLAKMAQGAAPLADATASLALTGKNEIVGTLNYMSPEQLQAQGTGQEVDPRSDIFSFGLVLFEMITGKRAFEGSSPASVIAAIMERPAPSIADVAPPALDRLLQRCLNKDPEERWQSARDVKAELDWIAAGPGDAPDSRAAAARPRGTLPWVIGAAVTTLLAVAALIGWYGATRPPSTSPLRLSIALPPGEQVTTAPAISPDGRVVAYAAGRTLTTSKLYLRTLDDFRAREVAGSIGAQHPFFSPDGRAAAFFADGKLRRVPVTGGTVTDIAPAPGAWGGTWGPDDSIVYTPNFAGGLWRIRAEGGAPEQLTKPDGAASGYAHVFPQFMPGTGDVLFGFWGRTFYTALFSAKTGAWREVTPAAKTESLFTGTYAGSGHFLAGDAGGSVRATEWTPAAARPLSPETLVLENVYWSLGIERPWLSLSANGTAVYAPGNPSNRHLVWVDRQGQVSPLPGESEPILRATVSRDGRRVAYDDANRSEWVVDIAGGTRTRIVSGVRSWIGGWLPGDGRIVVSSNMSGDWDLFTVGTGGDSELKPLLEKPYAQFAQSVAPDGSVVYMEDHPVTGTDLWTLFPDGRTAPLVVTRFNENEASVSPDGRFVAYVSNESGRNEVYAIPASGKGARVMISTEGGSGPVWSRDGRELFYRSGDDLMSVQVQTRDDLLPGARRKLLDVSGYDSGLFHEFDVSSDGRRFLFIRSDPDSRPVRLDVIVNWFGELKRKVRPQ